MCESIIIPGTDFHQIFIWGNLAARHSQNVHNTVTGCDGLSHFPLSHHPEATVPSKKYNPIKYKICEVAEKIWLQKEEQWDMIQLEQEIT
jgi:hypothetical protein